MAESVESAFLLPVLELLRSSIVTEFGLLWGVEEELDKLYSYMSAIQSVLQDAEENQIHSKQVIDWITKLKDVAYDAQDILDEFATEALRSKVEGENQTSTWKQSLPHRCEICHKIKDINKKLEEIANERRSARHLRAEGLPELRTGPETISLMHESDVLGREKDKEKLINLLVSDGSVAKELSVIPIVGMGGVGKTTLAQLIYNDESIEKHFEIRGWVCVSDDFDLKRLSKAIIESTSKRSSNHKELTSLAEEIKKIVSGKKFLLVLDDVWNEDSRMWEVLSAPMRCGAKGSKIIVTTRSEMVSRIMGTIDGYCLRILSDEVCWLLLGKQAFRNESWDGHPDLVAIGKEIAKKCRGLPLAAKTLGGLLQGTRQKRKWQDILTSEIWKLPQGGKYDILAPLRLSYHHLPSQLKLCFRYCSIFPKGSKFDKETLVKLWMAEGFIISDVWRREIEDVGSDYFDDLLWRSFFQWENGRYTMHDLIHDLAQSVSEGECFKMEDDMLLPSFEKVRYLSCFINKENDSSIIEKYLECKRLHTLLAFSITRTTYESISNNLFQISKFLRVLNLSGQEIVELPDSIGNLKHLRYLNISRTMVQRLPESLSSLYNLQTLDLNSCHRIVELPKDTRNLINLRHLDLPPYVHSMPERIGELTCLRTISNFVVGKENGDDQIGQLMGLINLRGKLIISSLQNAINAKEDLLKNKEYIEELTLSWDRDDDASVPVEILERLQPHPNLRLLKIRYYNGVRFPSWMGDPSFSNLKQVELFDCTCQTLPPLSQLPSLEILHIRKSDLTHVLGREICHGIMVTNAVAFPSLLELSLDSNTDLLEWGDGIEEGDFPQLRKLDIMNCESLIAFPRFLTSLCELCLDQFVNERMLNLVPYFTSLHSLKIGCFENIEVIPSGWFKNLKALKMFHISYCDGLVSLLEDEEDCKHLHSLKSLEISYCSQLTVLPNEGLRHLISLQQLSIRVLPQLTSLPDGLKNLISLKHLSIEDCEELATFPEEGLPTTLQSLSISKCPLALKCHKEWGDDWPKISHIPDIRVHS